MSENVRFYQSKMAENRAILRAKRSLGHQAREILAVVEECERRWALEDRIEKQLGNG